MALLALLTVALNASAQRPPPPPPTTAPHAEPAQTSATPPEGSWAAQLESLLQWANQQKQGARCTERCFTLERLRLRGAVGKGPLDFELEGTVLAPGAVDIPLFGPASRIRVEDVSENGKPAAVGFDATGYFLHTAARRFVVRGRLSVQGDPTLTIAGPLNSLEADLTEGRLVEGTRLSGLVGATVHFDASSGETPAAEPTVFQLSRAVRVGREIGFEYRLVMRSGADLGVATLPLRFGERVLEVQGSTGWRVDDQSLVLPTSGRSAQITITGTLPAVATFSPDDRSAYEWWLLESDAEHRLEVGGSGKQVDRTESPIPSTLPTARLFLVNKGQQIDVRVQNLASTEVLAAIVHGYTRMVVVTTKGDAVFDDRLQYENNGIDYLLFAPQGRPIYLDVDGAAQRIMHKQGAENEVLVPLRTGTHSARIQSLASAGLSRFGGALKVPMGSHPLTSSSVRLTVGLPEFLIPVATWGGDSPELFMGAGDAVAVLVAVIAGWLLMSTRRRRIGAVIAFAGLWFLVPTVFVAAMVVLALVVAVRIISRLLEGARRTAAISALAVLGLLAGVIVLAVVATSARYAAAPAINSPAATYDRGGEAMDAVSRSEPGASAPKTGNWAAQNAQGGVLEGVTPVALPLPSFERSVSIRREFVTRERPFNPVVYYITAWVLWPFAAAWLAVVIALVLAHRGELAALRNRLRGRFAAPAAAPAPAPPATSPDESLRKE